MAILLEYLKIIVLVSALIQIRVFGYTKTREKIKSLLTLNTSNESIKNLKHGYI